MEAYKSTDLLALFFLSLTAKTLSLRYFVRPEYNRFTKINNSEINEVRKLLAKCNCDK